MRAALLALLLAALPALSATVTLSTGPSCEYTVLSMQPNGTVQATCAGSQPIPPVPVPPDPTPTPPAGCPSIQAIDTSLTMGGINILRLASTQPAAAPLPVISASVPNNSGSVKIGETTISPDPVTIEMSISKCKGQIDPTAVAKGCYLKSTSRDFNAMLWIAKPVQGITQATADAMGWCLAYTSGGPYFVNIRYTYATCQYQPCGFAVTWGYGSV